MADKLIIFDTTLRDGEQSPGASMTRDEKLRIARQLERLRVDVIEAGFAASSNGDFEAVQTIANAIKDSTICSLSRANDRDISRAAEALKGANSGRIHTFIATSPLHMEKKLRMTPDQVVEQAVKSIAWAREYTDDVEFSAEDAGRSLPVPLPDEGDGLRCGFALGVLDQPMLAVEEQSREDFVPEAGQLGAQVVLDQRRRSEQRPARSFLVDNVPRSFQNLVGSRRQIAPLVVTHQQRGIERQRKLRHDHAPVARAELPGTVASTAQRKQSGIEDGR